MEVFDNSSASHCIKHTHAEDGHQSMDKDQLREHMRAAFEASLSQRLARSSRVNLQNIIPSHWFSAAASECQSMFIAGYFYGAICVAQAYVESLSKYLGEAYGVRGNPNDPTKRWEKLMAEKIVGASVRNAALAVLSDRNDFHHLNKEVEQDYQKLEQRAADCVNLLQSSRTCSPTRSMRAVSFRSIPSAGPVQATASRRRTSGRSGSPAGR
jgi:hypothetical protein